MYVAGLSFLLTGDTLAVLAIIGKIPFLTIKNWERAWLAKRQEILSHTYTTSTNSYQPLKTASTNLQTAILEACKELALNPAIIKWPTMASDIPDNVREICNIREWLVENELITEPVEASGQASSSSHSKGAIYQPCHKIC